jgi:hypothetical protein
MEWIALAIVAVIVLAIIGAALLPVITAVPSTAWAWTEWQRAWIERRAAARAAAIPPDVVAWLGQLGIDTTERTDQDDTTERTDQGDTTERTDQDDTTERTE